MKPSVSIVIPTYHRKESLLRLLKSLKGTPAEIIVVEQGDDNGKIFKKLVDRYIYLNKPSTPHAMNVGVTKAKGDLILFLDDDVTVTKDFLNTMLRLLPIQALRRRWGKYYGGAGGRTQKNGYRPNKLARAVFRWIFIDNPSGSGYSNRRQYLLAEKYIFKAWRV